MSNKSILVDQNVECRWCKKSYTIKVDAVSYEMWCCGFGNIQNLMPELSADDREMLISQTCKECWNKIFDTN